MVLLLIFWGVSGLVSGRGCHAILVQLIGTAAMSIVSPLPPPLPTTNLTLTPPTTNLKLVFQIWIY